MNLKPIVIISMAVCPGLAYARNVHAFDPAASIPTSHDSPEGIAADLDNACVTRDFDAFNEARAKSSREGRTDPVNDYVMFRNNTTLFKDGEPIRETNLLSTPGRISRVYSAHPLTTKKEREIAGAFVRGGLEPVLVVVVIEDRQGNELLHRTIVVKSGSSGLWYAQPQLAAHAYLSELLLELPRSESVSWQMPEASDNGQ